MVDWSGIGRAVLDVNRREQGLPTQDEQLLKQAMDELKRRQAFATAGLTEAQAAALPQQQDLQRRVQEATITAREAQARSADALAASRANEQPEGTIKQSSDGTFYRIVDDKAYPVTMAEAQAAGENPAASQGGSPLVGRVPGAGGGGSENVIGPTVTMWRNGKAVIVDRRTGQEVGEAPPLAASQQMAGKMGAAMDIVGDLNDPDTITSLAMELNAGNDGVIDRAMGSILSLAGQSGYTGTIGGKSAQSANVYNSQMRGMASILAKSFGESGRLSDQDIERTVQMFPVIGEPAPVTERKIARIKSLIRAIAHSPEGSAEQNSLLVDQAAMELGGRDTGAGVVEPGGGVMAPSGADPLEGRTATGPNGEKVIRKGGRWVPIQ